MRDLMRFNTGELFGIKIKDSTDGDIKIVTLGTYNYNKHGFNYIILSYDLVAGPYQALRFETKAQAQQWIYKHCTEFGYEAEDMQVSEYVGSGMFWKVPIIGFDVDAWVSTRKFDTYSDAQMDRLISEVPEYFAYPEWSSDEEAQSLEGNYRGFKF